MEWLKVAQYQLSTNIKKNNNPNVTKYSTNFQNALKPQWIISKFRKKQKNLTIKKAMQPLTTR
jgi:hypothetical protein